MPGSKKEGGGAGGLVVGILLVAALLAVGFYLYRSTSAPKPPAKASQPIHFIQPLHYA